MADPNLLVPIFVAWAMACAAIGAVTVRRAPAVSLAVFGSILGAVAGYLVENADGPAEVPAYTAVGASIGLVANGILGMLATRARPPSAPLRRAGWVTLTATPSSPSSWRCPSSMPVPSTSAGGGRASATTS